MKIELEVGPQVSPDGQSIQPRAGKAGEIIVQELHGRYTEQVYRGNVFFAHGGNAALTFSVGLTTTTMVGLIVTNPIGSGKLLVPMQAEFSPSGVVVGGVALCSLPYTITAFPHTTALTVRNAYISGGLVSVANADSGMSAGPVTPIPAKMLFACLSTNTAQGAAPVLYDLGGSLIVPPGCGVAMLATTAITGWPSLTWEEIAI